MTLSSESLVDDLRRMGKQLAPGFICAPTWVMLRTEDSEERLDWGFDIGRGSDPPDLDRDQWNRVRTPRDLLPSFLKLADAPAKRIETFAKRCGVLGICKDHGLPVSHQRGCQPLGFPLECHELLSSWREMSRRLGAVSRIATELSADNLGADADWWTLYPHFEKNQPFSNIWVDETKRKWRVLKRQRELSLARYYLRGEVDELLKLGDVRLQLEWQPVSRLGGVGPASSLGRAGSLWVLAESVWRPRRAVALGVV